MHFPCTLSSHSGKSLGRLLRRCGLWAGLLCITLALPVFGQEAKAPELSEKTSEEIGKIKQYLEDPAQHAALILAAVEPYLAKVDRKSFDFAYLSQLRANVLLRSGKHIEAIGPLEDSLREGFFAGEKMLEMKFLLSALYYQDAFSVNDKDARIAKLNKAKRAFEEWLKVAPEPMLGAPTMGIYLEVVTYLGNTLFNLEDFKGAVALAERAVRLSVEPKDQVWVLLFASQHAAGMPEAAAETFELFLQKFPGKKEYWPQLAQAYLYSEQRLRAILTYERAQAKGAMSDSAAYTNLFNLYYMIGEYSRAAELLASWIKSGKVENTEDNWDRIASCFTTLHREDDSRRVLDEGRKHFKTGNLDYELAQYLWYDGKYPEGLATAVTAWKKGGLTKPGKAALFLATAYSEQREWELAKQYLDEATKHPDAEKRDIERVTKFVIPGYNEWKNRLTPAVTEAPKKS